MRSKRGYGRFDADDFELAIPKKAYGLAIAAVVLNLVFWLALIAGALILVKVLFL